MLLFYYINNLFVYFFHLTLRRCITLIAGFFVANPTSEELDARREQQIQDLPERE